MTRSEWVQAVRQMTALWPNGKIPDRSIGIWYSTVRDLPALQVEDAIGSFFREGNGYPPTAGQILARVTMLDRDDPDHGEAWRLVRHALAKHGAYDWTAFYDELRERAPAVELAARRYNFEPSGYLTDDESTVRAQFRDIYKSVCSERSRDAALTGLPSAGLKRLERLNGAPRRLDPGKALQ